MMNTEDRVAKATPKTILAESLRDFRRTWPQLLMTDVMSRLIALIIIAPLAGVGAKLFLWRASDGVIADAHIISFLLHPFGLAALIVVAAVSLGILFAEIGQLLVIGFGATEDRRVTWLEAYFYSYRRAVGLVHLAGAAVVRLLLIAVPFLVALGGIFWLLVRSHDINYYLARKPPEFTVALGAAGALVAVLAVLVAWKIAGWFFAIPMVLFEGMGGRQSLRASVAATTSRRREITLWLLGWPIVTALILYAVTHAAGLIGVLIVSRLAERINSLLITLSLVTAFGVFVYLAVTIFLTILFALCVVRFYRSMADGGKLQPEIAPRGSLGQGPSIKIPAKATLAVAVLFFGIVVVGVTLAVDEPGWQDPTEIIAHRGGAWVAPENTMAAFKQAIVDGADWIELDVQENADGIVIVEHDRDFMRAAGVKLEVWQATNEDLADLDIGSFFAPEFSDQRVPTLREVLDLAKGKIGVVIELKYYGHNVNLEQKVIDLVEEIGMSSDVVIMSLDHDGVLRATALRPDWTYGLLNAVAIGDLTKLDVDFLALTGAKTTASMVRHTHKNNMMIYPWTVNDPVQMWVMMGRGADAIITDRVALANRIKKTRANVTPVGRLIIGIAGELGLLRGWSETPTAEDA